MELNRFAKQAKHLKKSLFQKRRWSCDFPLRKTPVAEKHLAISRQEKDSILHPRRIVLGLHSPSPSVCTGGRAGGHTLTSRPKFLGSIGYQICLAMVLHWRAMRVGSAIMNYLIMGCLNFSFHTKLISSIVKTY